jgi:hypothetical protein
VVAAHRRTSMKNLVIQGLEMVLQKEVVPAQPAEALARLRGGYHLGGRPMTREEIHARELLSEVLNHGQNYGQVRVINPFLV